jgi:hypothetical protein
VFAEGRKTCLLGHNRQADLSHVEYAVHRVSEIIDLGEAQDLVGKCEKLFKHAVLAGLGVPDVSRVGL